jgi:hypothetical protein
MQIAKDAQEAAANFCLCRKSEDLVGGQVMGYQRNNQKGVLA